MMQPAVTKSTAKSPVRSPPRNGSALAGSRLDLYRLLSDEGRLRLLALTAAEELSVGELAELVGESQPQVSKKVAALRRGGLLLARREGTRTLLAAEIDPGDAVVEDALLEGQRLCHEDGSLARVAQVVAAREESGRRFFDEDAPLSSIPAAEDPARPAVLFALSTLLERRRLAVDVGCGEGLGLESLAPLFERVFAVDRSQARLAQASRRIVAHGLSNVSLLHGSWDETEVLRRTDEAGGADLVLAGRVLHHAARPEDAVRGMARLLAPGGRLVVLDYAPHDDEGMRAQGDVWLGFGRADLEGWLSLAGLVRARVLPVPAAFHAPPPAGDDGRREGDLHLPWLVAVGQRREPEPEPRTHAPGGR